jgi:chromosome condensin MukBEF complex kleisin-like MukF subunit
MDDRSERHLLGRIGDMIDEEHRLRQQLAAGTITESAEHERLTDLERQLDQCWDLLRQRRARVAAGQDPDQAAVRSVDEVEKYLS